MYRLFLIVSICNKLVFDNNQRDKENSAYSLCYHLMKKSPDYVKKLDWRVYSIDREFRMPLAYKSPSDKRQLQIVPYNGQTLAEVRAYLVTAYDKKNHVIINCDRIRDNEFIEKKKHQRKIKRTIPNSLPKTKKVYVDPANEELAQAIALVEQECPEIFNSNVIATEAVAVKDLDSESESD